MQAARPSSRPGATTAPTRTTGPATTGAPRVRDFATPVAGFRIEWDVRTVYDFLFSLSDDHEFPHDLLDADRAWLTESRAALEAAHPDVETLLASEMAIFVAAFAVEHPELTTIDAFLDALDVVPTQELLSTILCDLVRDPELGGLVEKATTGDAKAVTRRR